jgi:hypothetical protein
MKQLITKLNLTDLTNAYGMSEPTVHQNILVLLKIYNPSGNEVMETSQQYETKD